MFRFKQFSIQQQQSAMKVGTDGVLLGAWTPAKSISTVLDVGTGTGLIALMLAQRTLETTQIHAVEVEEEACKEAAVNFKNSPWSDRLSVTQGSFLDYTNQPKYDLIVSNPPYFTDTFKQESSGRTLARHVGNLTFKSLLKKTSSLLTNNGACAFIIPHKEETLFLKTATEFGLFPKKLCRIKGKTDLPFKRSLLYLTKNSYKCSITELTIEIDRHIYTQEYIELTKSFYLKM